MFQNAMIGLSRHAIDRFKLRIDPTATVEQIVAYVRQSVPPTHIQRMMRQFDYTLDELFTMNKTVYAQHKHITFVLAKKRGKGRNQVAVITCF